MTIRTITGTIEYADGSIPQNSRAEFYLNGVHIDAVTIAHSAVYVPLDETGDITVDLYPNDVGYGADRYNVDLVTYSDSEYIREIRRVNLGKIFVEDEDGQNLQSLLALFSGPAGELSVAEQAAQDAIDAAAEAAVSAAAAALHDGAEVDEFADLADLTQSIVPVGGYVRVTNGGLVYKRAADAATDFDYDYTGSGGIKLYKVTSGLHTKPGETIVLSGNGDDGSLLTLKSGAMYFNGTSDVPDVPITGLFNIKDENGVIHMAIWPDLQGDGDYDADFWYNGNAYHNTLAGFETIFGSAQTPNGPSDGNRGRIRFACTGDFAGRGTTNVNVIQSGVDFDGATINHLAIGPYKSGSFWTYWDKTTGNMGVGTTDVRARLHVQSGGTQPALVESSAATSRLGFRGSSQANDTTATIGIDSAGRLVAAGQSTDIFKLGSTGMQAATDNTLTCGTAAFRWLRVYATEFRPGAGAVIWTSGAGTPEGAVTAPVGSMYTSTNGGAGTTLYVKESGTGNTGWVAK